MSHQSRFFSNGVKTPETAAEVFFSETRSGSTTANYISYMSSATEFIWGIFQQNNPPDRKDVQKVTLYIENGNGVAYIVNNETQPVTRKGNSLGCFIMRIEMIHVWQWGIDWLDSETLGGVIEGIADFVRLKADYAPSHWVKPGHGYIWDQGYNVTANRLQPIKARNGSD
ncbi:hypothetical protein COLO4_32582 [Corchorus olitorius]|uniref:Uncharacterized protein n=1 Tax=Corchorus olitorius TaxID=93759 RepID=A0A1R3GYS4_9ROSI|nr:hypothetical protein COLO4_32582 [Corchorus olitorius]